MELYSYKYTPKHLKEFIINVDIIKSLINYSKTPALLSHLIIYGVNGVGKYSIARALINDIYQSSSSIIIQNDECQESNTKFQYIYYKGKYHLELDPSLYHSNDHYVIEDVLNQIVASKSIQHKSSQLPTYVMIIIRNAHKLSKYSQEIIRNRAKSSRLRFILLCPSPSPFILGLKSRFINIRLPAPNEKIVIKLLANIVAKENLNITRTNLKDIIKRSTQSTTCQCINLKDCINRLQIMYGYDKYIKYIPIHERSLNKLIEIITKPNLIANSNGENINSGLFHDIRETLYTLQNNQINSRNIIKYIHNKLLNNIAIFNIKDYMIPAIINLTTFIEHMAIKGTVQVLYTENYIYNLIKILNT